MNNQKRIEVIAEIHFRPEGKPAQSYLLGADFQLYRHNDLKHALNPFSEPILTSPYQLGYSLEHVLMHSTLTLKDGTECKGEEYCNNTAPKN